MKRLEVDVFTPVPVPESKEEEAGAGPRFIPLQTARRLVERGLGSWAWIGEAAARILAGPLPEGFPHASALRRAGYGLLERLPLSLPEIARIRGLVDESRPTKSQKDRAAREVLDALDALLRQEA